MKLIKLMAVLCFCSSVALAETTVDMIQQRAEVGDAQAQSLMGLMANYGYKVSKDGKVAQKWYQRAADQGDSFAAQRVDGSAKKFDVAQTGSSNKPSEDVKSFNPSLSQTETIEKKIAEASSAEYKGGVTVDDLPLQRAKCVGKVVELRFETCRYSSGDRAIVCGQKQLGLSERLNLCGQEALEWAVGQSKRPGASGRVYVLVDERDLIALGTHRSRDDNGYTYSW